MKIFIGSDHAGFEIKELIKNIKFVKKSELDFIDIGTHNKNSCDYPDYALKLVKKLKQSVPLKKTSEQQNFGILICGTGIGMCMVANRFSYIRAAVCNSIDEAKLARLHNNANILCIGARIVKAKEIKKIVEVFLFTPYEGGRHNARINKF